MLVIFACAMGLRTSAKCSIPGSLMLSVQVAFPVRKAESSLRGTLVPMYHSAVSVMPLLSPKAARSPTVFGCR
jgi:hypothetical protein